MNIIYKEPLKCHWSNLTVQCNTEDKLNYKSQVKNSNSEVYEIIKML